MRYTIFETANGHAAIGWRGDKVTSFRLPAATLGEIQASIRRRMPNGEPGEPSPRIAQVIAAARRYFAGEHIDFSDVPLDLSGQGDLFLRVYERVRRLGWGETSSYGAVAKDLGLGPEYARDVGQAMAHNPVPLIIPCHRVLAAGGKLGGFSAPGGSDSKARMLEMEGVAVAGSAPPARETAQTSFGF